MQYDSKQDKLIKVNKSKSLIASIKLFTGFSDNDIKKDLLEKQKVLSYLVKNNIDTVDGVGQIMAEYYTKKEILMKRIKLQKN